MLNYKPPKETDEIDDMTKFLREEGCSSKIVDAKKEKIKELHETKAYYKEENKKHSYNNNNNSYKREHSNKYPRK